ncbi:MAG: hypothetical protein ACK5GN_05760 [Pseudomonadota bacterium]|jgi:hypothetical protein
MNRSAPRLILLLATALFLSPLVAQADQPGRTLGSARPEVAAEAVAHYARSRALLVAAINEFDKARKLAKPDELLDSTKWRATLIDRAEDLERVLDPQPRATRGGIKFEADPRLLPEAKR